MQPQIGRRLEQRWPYYFFYGRLIRQHQGGEGGGRRGGGEGGGGSGTTLKSYNPNIEGGEKSESFFFDVLEVARRLRRLKF